MQSRINRPKYAAIVAAIGVIFAAACTEPQGDVTSFGAVVYGNVVTPNNTPVANASLQAVLFAERCDASSRTQIGGSFRAQSGSTGTYRIVVGAINLDNVRCLRVSDSASAASAEGPVNLHQPPYDSTRINLVTK